MVKPEVDGGSTAALKSLSCTNITKVNKVKPKMAIFCLSYYQTYKVPFYRSCMDMQECAEASLRVLQYRLRWLCTKEDREDHILLRLLDYTRTYETTWPILIEFGINWGISNRVNRWGGMRGREKPTRLQPASKLSDRHLYLAVFACWGGVSIDLVQVPRYRFLKTATTLNLQQTSRVNTVSFQSG